MDNEDNHQLQDIMFMADHLNVLCCVLEALNKTCSCCNMLSSLTCQH